jgi:hypothetical protein
MVKEKKMVVNSETDQKNGHEKHGHKEHGYGS